MNAIKILEKNPVIPSKTKQKMHNISIYYNFIGNGELQSTSAGSTYY